MNFLGIQTLCKRPVYFLIYLLTAYWYIQRDPQSTDHKLLSKMLYSDTILSRYLILDKEYYLWCGLGVPGVTNSAVAIHIIYLYVMGVTARRNT